MTPDQKSCSDKQQASGVNLSTKLTHLLGNLVFPERLEGFGTVRDMQSIELMWGASTLGRVLDSCFSTLVWAILNILSVVFEFRGLNIME